MAKSIEKEARCGIEVAKVDNKTVTNHAGCVPRDQCGKVKPRVPNKLGAYKISDPKES